MLFLQQALVFTIVLSSALAAPHHHEDSIVDWTRLNSILDSIDNNVLHNVLHTLTPKFRDGVFSKDRAAIEHVHSENPTLASKIVYIAKRQDNGTTTADPEPSGTQTVDSEPTISETTPVVVDPTTTVPSSSADPVTTTAADDSTSASSTAEVSNDSSPVTSDAPTSTTAVATVDSSVSAAVASQITQSELPSPTTVLVAPSAEEGETPIATADGAVVYSTAGGGVITKTSSAVGVSFTRSTSTHYYYSTAADGSVVTSTSLVVVNAPVTETAVPTGAAGAAATSGDPGLQNAGDRSSSNSVIAGLVMGVAGLFLGL